jgi:hypothetical protein
MGPFLSDPFSSLTRWLLNLYNAIQMLGEKAQVMVRPLCSERSAPMVIPIPYGMKYTSTVGGTVVKLVHCESCQGEYVYQMARKASGSGSSFLFNDNEDAAARAAAYAEQALLQKLNAGVDVVPCPACGWVQRHMVPKARRLHCRWMFHVGVGLTAGLIPLAMFGGIFNGISRAGPTIPWPVFGACLVALFLLGIGLIIGKAVLASRYDPNTTDVETRKQQGQWRAMLRQDYERMIQAQSQGKTPPEGTPSGDAATQP